jgi:2-polyprenyl-3-methyl-5-hydroxy-6-metoxy-1,4-benzoquinol methylase
VGFDFSVQRIEWARATVSEVRFDIADVYTTDLLESVPYNTVVCTEFLEHVKGDVEVLRQVRACSAPSRTSAAARMCGRSTMRTRSPGATGGASRSCASIRS